MRLGQIDVIRGFAALSVAITHLSQQSIGEPLAFIAAALVTVFSWTFGANQGLHAGVVIFIVLSGFCIHLPVARNPALADAPHFWGVYARRRAIRILPVFILGAALGMLLHGFWDWSPVLWNVAVGAFMPVGSIPGNEILHTVVVEMWLYAAYPITLAIFRRSGSRMLLLSAGLVHLGAIGALLLGANPDWAQRSWFAFYLYWVIGMLAAEAFVRKSALSMQAVAVAFAAYMLVSHLMHLKGSHYLKSLALAGITALILMSWRGRNRFPAAFVKVGEASYTLYVVHLPVITWWVVHVSMDSLANQLGLVALIAVATLMGYLLVESPAHRLARGYRLASLASQASR